MKKVKQRSLNMMISPEVLLSITAICYVMTCYVFFSCLSGDTPV